MSARISKRIPPMKQLPPLHEFSLTPRSIIIDDDDESQGSFDAMGNFNFSNNFNQSSNFNQSNRLNQSGNFNPFTDIGQISKYERIEHWISSLTGNSSLTPPQIASNKEFIRDNLSQLEKMRIMMVQSEPTVKNIMALSVPLAERHHLMEILKSLHNSKDTTTIKYQTALCNLRMTIAELASDSFSILKNPFLEILLPKNKINAKSHRPHHDVVDDDEDDDVDDAHSEEDESECSPMTEIANAFKKHFMQLLAAGDNGPIDIIPPSELNDKSNSEQAKKGGLPSTAEQLPSTTITINTSNAVVTEIIKGKKWSSEVIEIVLSRLGNLTNNPFSQDAQKLKQWAVFACKIPDSVKTLPVNRTSKAPKITKFVDQIRTKLQGNIYGMPAVKEELLEFILQVIAITNSRGVPDSAKSTRVILLDGPPGIGKTELCMTLAEAIGLPLIKIPLGGISDAAMLVGHGSTYVGSMPGRIAIEMSKCQYSNPIIFFDEIDKISQKHNGEVNGALTHIMDETQNSEFMDQYLEFPIDLSKCLFICTSNEQQQIDPILLDRMSIIKLKGYSIAEKNTIASKFLIPQLLKEYHMDVLPRNANTRSKSKKTTKLISTTMPSTTPIVIFTDDIIANVVREYTVMNDEVGVRGLKRHIKGIISRLNGVYLTNNNYVECRLSKFNIPHTVTEADLYQLRRQSTNDTRAFMSIYS